MGSLIALKGRSSKNAAVKAKPSGKKAKVVHIKLKKPVKFSGLTDRQRDQIVINYRLKARKLARSILRRWHARMDLTEVDSIVDLSLCESAKRFNPNVGASFMTFLFYHLRGNLIRAVSAAANSNLVPLADIESNFSGYEDGEMSGGNSHSVNAIEIAEALCGNDFPLPDEIVYKRELVKMSSTACDKLDNLAKEVINRIYIQGQQLIDIANSLGYSRCHISRVKKKALEALFEDMSGCIGLPADAKRPDVDDDDDGERSKVTSIHKQVHRRKPRSKKLVLAKSMDETRAAN
jgi:RNA polymerase sigma factor (sigma-70 family)